MELLYLSRKDVERTGFSGADMLRTVEAVFRSKKAGRAELPPKPGIHPRERSFLHAMPGYLPDQDAAGIKWIGYYPGNAAKKLPTINGLVIANDPETGLPTCVMDAGWITAYRTAAVSALSCRLLAAGTPRTLGIAGYGVQAESHLDLLAELFPLEQVQVWGPDAQKCRTFAACMSGRLSLPVEAVSSAEAMVREKDLVASVTPIGVEPATRLRYAWLRPGTVVCPVEFDCAWDTDLFRKADGLFTDDITQMEYYRSAKGFFADVPQAAGELADLLDSPPRRSAEQILVAVNLGVGILDIAFAREIEGRARHKGIGTPLPR